MTQLGTCTKCRGRSVVSDCKIEAFAGESTPVYTLLCRMCIDGFKIAVVTVCFAQTEKPKLIQVYS